jgi:hypothetical protein
MGGRAYASCRRGFGGVDGLPSWRSSISRSKSSAGRADAVPWRQQLIAEPNGCTMTFARRHQHCYISVLLVIIFEGGYKATGPRRYTVAADLLRDLTHSIPNHSIV